MASFKIVLPLLLLSLIEVKASNDQEGLTYIDALTIAVTYVNENSEDKNAYWLNGHELQPQWNNTSREPHYLSFIVKETNCLTTQTLTPIACAFKENGKEKYCQGVIVAINEKEANVWAKCVPVGSTEVLSFLLCQMRGLDQIISCTKSHRFSQKMISKKVRNKIQKKNNNGQEVNLNWNF